MQRFYLICKHANLSKLGTWISLTNGLTTRSLARSSTAPCHLPGPPARPSAVARASRSHEPRASYPLGLVVGHQLIDGGCSGHLQQDWLGGAVGAGSRVTQGAGRRAPAPALALHADPGCHALGARLGQAGDVLRERQHLGVSLPLLRLVGRGVACQTQTERGGEGGPETRTRTASWSPGAGVKSLRGQKESLRG